MNVRQNQSLCGPVNLQRTPILEMRQTFSDALEKDLQTFEVHAQIAYQKPSLGTPFHLPRAEF